MQTTRRTLLAAGGAAALAPAAALAQARWQMATPYPDGNYHTRNVRAFLEDAKTATAGRVDVQVHSNGALLPMPQIKRGVQTGQVQLGEILLSAYANEDPFFEVDGVPFLAWTWPQAEALNAATEPYVRARLERAVGEDVELVYAGALRDRANPRVNRQLLNSVAQP